MWNTSHQQFNQTDEEVCRGRAGGCVFGHLAPGHNTLWPTHLSHPYHLPPPLKNMLNSTVSHQSCTKNGSGGGTGMSGLETLQDAMCPTHSHTHTRRCLHTRACPWSPLTHTPAHVPIPLSTAVRASSSHPVRVWWKEIPWPGLAHQQLLLQTWSSWWGGASVLWLNRADKQPWVTLQSPVMVDSSRMRPMPWSYNINTKPHT